MAISQELADVYLGNPYNVYYFEAIDIAHTALTSDLHYTNNSFHLTGLLDNTTGESAQFSPLPFSAVLPEKNTEGNQSLGLSVSNVTTDLIDYIEQMAAAPQSPMELTYRVFLSTQKNASGAYMNQLVPAWRFEVSDVIAREQQITMSATKLNTHNRSFPRVRYTRITFPGLSR